MEGTRSLERRVKKHGEELRKGAKRVEGLLEARIKAMENSKTPGRASRSNRREEEDLKFLRTAWVVAAWV